MTKLDGIDIELSIKRQYPDATFKFKDGEIKNWSSASPKPTVSEVLTAEKAFKKQQKTDLLAKLGLTKADFKLLLELIESKLED